MHSRLRLLVRESPGRPETTGLRRRAFLASGTQAAFINEDGSLNEADHPATASSAVALFLTGAGVTDPPTADGVAPGLPLPLLASSVTVNVGGVPAEVTYAGSVLGYARLAQITFRVPEVAASNTVPVKVAIGGQSRDQAVTIAIH